MQTYLIIITTVLVLTQIIRVTQNAMQLKRIGTRMDADNELIRKVYRKLEIFLDMVMEGTELW